MAPRAPKRPLHSLPPILRKICQASIPGYSKGSRGLSVLPRVCSIFTTTTISPSWSLRQCSSRYAVHARRNLPDKELRYLRTVIVTAAVHQGLDLELAPLLVTFWHWAGISLYTSSYDLAQTCVFGKQLHGFIRCVPTLFTE